MVKIQFYYDIVSPYSYLAFNVLLRLQKPWNIDLDLRPFFLGGVMKATGNTPPALLPARAPYLLRDLMRQSQYYQVPVCIPPDFPANTLSTQRLLTAARSVAPDYLQTLTQCLWEGHYAQGLAVNDPVLIPQALEKSGLSSPKQVELLELSQTQDIKDQLKKETELAIERGAFGAPTLFVNQGDSEEMFFGSDRFHLIASLLGQPWDASVGFLGNCNTSGA